MYLKKIVVLFLVPMIIVLGQSVHQKQNEIFKRDYGKITDSHIPKQNNTKFNPDKVNAIKTVFGYLPWWNYITDNYNHRPELINRIAVFSFEADSLGNLTPPPLWPWNDILNYEIMMWPLDISVIMTVTSFNGEHINGFLRNNSIRQNLIRNIKEHLGIMSGVNIDFENLEDEDKGEYIVNFMKELSDSVKKDRPGAEISFAAPSYGYGLWNFKGLAEACDYLFIMCYDFYGSWSTTTGPSSPLTGTFFSVTKIFEEEYKDVPPEKLIMGVPYYGNYWKTDSSFPYAEVTPYNPDSTYNDWQDFVVYDSAHTLSMLYNKSWDNISQTPWITWQDDSWNQVWYDDSLSLSLKYDLALQKNLKGVGIWAIGYDGNREELWSLIRDKFKTTSAPQIETKPTGFVLFQNYPNPFNPSTTIEYTIPNVKTTRRVVFTTLKVYDILGREIATLVEEYQQPGEYSVKFDVETHQGASLPSGVSAKGGYASGLYFYTLIIRDTSPRSVFQETKKMLLIK
ncbi:MAG: glycosyl hydrolase family 18 protein [Bacteroidota bacterium]